MDERPTSASVAIHKGVDGLKLGMSYRCLRDGRKIVSAAERTEVVNQTLDEFVGWWNECCRARVVGATTNPVLLVSELAAVFFLPGSNKKTAMHFEEHVGRDGIAITDAFDGEDHGIDVVE